MSFNSWQRTASTPNRFKFQGQEHIDDLGLNWDSFKWRNQQPDIGRFFNVDPLAEKYVYNSPYAFSENAVTRYRELEGLEKIDFMVAIYEPNKQPRSGFPTFNPNPTFNEKPNEVISHTADQYLGFRVDFENGNLTLERGLDWDKNMFEVAWGQLANGDGFSLDYTIEVTDDNGSFTIGGNINDSSFEINATIDGDKITINSSLKNVDEDKGGVIKATGGNEKIKPSLADWYGDVINVKPAEENTTNSSNQVNYNFTIKNGETILEPLKKKN